jgi:hypothetical protein
MAKKAWTPKQLERLNKLHGQMGSTNTNESEAARKHILKMLIDHDCSWNDMIGLLQLAQQAQQSAAPKPPPPPGERITASELYRAIQAVYEEHVTLDADALVVCPLWVMHAYVFRLFLHTPRLLLRAPFAGHGKSRTRRITEAFIPNLKRSDNASAATFFRWTDKGHNVSLDELDNLGLTQDRTFLAALNSGFEPDGSTARYIQGEEKEFSTFGATLLTGIGTVPSMLARRSIIINMQYDPNVEQTRRLFNRADPKLNDTIDIINVHLAAWASDPELNLAPPMPIQLTGEQCDVWRVLISIADTCGTVVGELARQVAIRMCRALDRVPEIVLLRDIRLIFNERHADRLLDKVVLADLRKQRTVCGPAGEAKMASIHRASLPSAPWQNCCGTALRSRRKPSVSDRARRIRDAA